MKAINLHLLTEYNECKDIISEYMDTGNLELKAQVEDYTWCRMNEIAREINFPLAGDVFC